MSLRRSCAGLGLGSEAHYFTCVLRARKRCCRAFPPETGDVIVTWACARSAVRRVKIVARNRSQQLWFWPQCCVLGAADIDIRHGSRLLLVRLSFQAISTQAFPRSAPGSEVTLPGSEIIDLRSAHLHPAVIVSVRHDSIGRSPQATRANTAQNHACSLEARGVTSSSTSLIFRKTRAWACAEGADEYHQAWLAHEQPHLLKRNFVIPPVCWNLCCFINIRWPVHLETAGDSGLQRVAGLLGAQPCVPGPEQCSLPH